MYRPPSAAQPLQMNPATPAPRPNPAPIPFAAPFQHVGVPRPAPYPAPSHHTWRPPAFPPPVLPPGAFHAPPAYQPPPPPPAGFRPPPHGFRPPSGGFHPHPRTHVHQFGFRPSHTYPRVSVLSHQRPAAIDGTFDAGAVTGPHITPVPPANVFGPGGVTRSRPTIPHVSPANVFGPGAVTKPRLPIAPVPQAYVFGPGTLTRPPISPVHPANVFGPRGVTNPPITPVPRANGFVLRAVSTPHITPVRPANVFGPGVVSTPPIAPVPLSNVCVPQAITRPPIAYVPPANVFGPGGVTRPVIAHIPPANVFVPGAVYRPPIASTPPSNYSGPGGLTRPPVAPVPPVNGPQFKLYVGKIASTVDNDFVLSLLQVCGHVKSWNPVTNPIDGTPTGFGFCDFESAEDSLRAWRLLNKLSIDGRELVINVNEATKEHLQKHGESTIEEKASEADKDAIQTIHSMIEERMKSKLPESVIPPVQVSGKRKREEDENLAEREVVGLQGWQHREVTSAGKSSAGKSIYMPMECASIIEHERKRQHRERDCFHKSNGEGKGMVYVPVLVSDRLNNSSMGEKVGFELQATSASGNEKTLDAEQLTSAVKSTYMPMECASIIEHERKLQHREGDWFQKSNGEGKGIVYVPVLVSDRLNNSMGEKVGFGLQATSTSGSEKTLDAEQLTSAGKSTYMLMECASIIEHERKLQHTERKWFHKSNGEGKGIVYVPVLVSDRLNNSSTVEKVGFELQATSTSGNEKTLDAEQLLAAVPKMKEELFAYDVNWAIYDKHGLHERMRRWVSEKCIEVFGEEIPEFVEYVVASTKEHVEAPGMLEPLASLMDDSAENFLLSLWTQLIFEIKKAEAGLA